MASHLYLKHGFNLSNEEVVERWAQNVFCQPLCGKTHYEPRLPCNVAQLGHFRSAIGEAGVKELFKATIDTAVATEERVACRRQAKSVEPALRARSA